MEAHVDFIMEYFASFGTTMVPNMGIHKSVISELGKRYQIYPKARQLKDIASVLNVYAFKITFPYYYYY